ncbi:hypothetical protein J0H58_07700 [bacterium]|nr:hypothetical protein [bacterium]
MQADLKSFEESAEIRPPPQPAESKPPPRRPEAILAHVPHRQPGHAATKYDEVVAGLRAENANTPQPSNIHLKNYQIILIS